VRSHYETHEQYDCDHRRREVTKQFPELNIVVNNADIMREINVHDKAGSLEDLTREIEINLSGPIRMVCTKSSSASFNPGIRSRPARAITAANEANRMNGKHQTRQVLLDCAWPSDFPEAGVGSSSTPLRDIEGSVH
jgi:hypothetical protein